MKKFYLSLFVMMSLSAPFAVATVHTVNVEDYQFSPSVIAVSVNDTITWRWIAGVHTTTSTSVPLGTGGWNQPIDAGHQTYSYKIVAAGQYDYQCNYHTVMNMYGHISATATVAVPQIPATLPASFNIIGNPVRDELKISYNVSSTSPVSITMIDITGKVVKTFISSSREVGNIHYYAVAGIPRGLYILLLQTEDINIARRVILQ